MAFYSTILPILALFLVSQHVEAQLSLNNPNVILNYCTVTGSQYLISTTTTQSYSILAFTGIPYAMEPTVSYRFGPPRSIASSIDCPSRQVKCRQFGERFNTRTTPPNIIEESEDCLHLNVYSPVEQSAASGPFPVLVYIHGGEFKYGGKDMFKPDYLFDSTMVNGYRMVVVTLNYRLGPLGFLSTDDTNQPGNNGIRDQIMALQWVNENIARFNGNPAQVTIMGHDAGGVSVGMHVLNKDVGNYFRAAISISGTVFSPWAFQQVPVQQARDFGTAIGNCPYQSDQLVDCLRYSSVDTMIQTVKNSENLNTNRQPYWFRPVVDKNVSSSAILEQTPEELYAKASFNPVPYLVVATENEGTLDYYLRLNQVNNLVDTDSKIAYLIRPYINPYTDEDVIASALQYQYFDRTERSASAFSTLNETHLDPREHSNSSSKRDIAEYSNEILSQILTDYLYIAPMDYTARLHSAAQAQAIVLVFAYQGTKSFGTLQIGAPTVSRDNYAVTHNNDMWYCMLNDYDLTALTGNEINLYQAYGWFLAKFVLQGNADAWVLRYSQSIPSYNQIKASVQVTPVPAANGKGYRTEYSDFINNFVVKLEETSQSCLRSSAQKVIHSQITMTLASMMLLLRIYYYLF